MIRMSVGQNAMKLNDWQRVLIFLVISVAYRAHGNCINGNVPKDEDTVADEFLQSDNPTIDTTTILGKSFWPPAINLFELLQGGTPVYNDVDIDRCLSIANISESPSTLTYYEENDAFYKSIASDLDVAVQFISFGSVSNTISHLLQDFQETSYQGAQLDYGQYVKSFNLNKACLVQLPLDPVFIQELAKLPLNIQTDSSLDSFDEYRKFVSIYGGFILTEVKVGARLEVFSTAEESQGYTEQQFRNRACAQLSLSRLTLPINIGPCVDLSSHELQYSVNLEMTTKYFPRGGDTNLQAELSTQGITPTVLTKFIQSAGENPYPVDYKLTPIWDLYTGYNETISKRLDNLRLYFNLLSVEDEGASDPISKHNGIPVYAYVLIGMIPSGLFIGCVTVICIVYWRRH